MHEETNRLNSGNAYYHSVQYSVLLHVVYKLKGYNIQNHNSSCSFLWMRNLVPTIKGKTLTEDVGKESTEKNIWT
jgi:hypothetical protein